MAIATECKAKFELLYDTGNADNPCKEILETNKMGAVRTDAIGGGGKDCDGVYEAINDTIVANEGSLLKNLWNEAKIALGIR